MNITGLGPHGERASDIRHLQLTISDVNAARANKFRVSIILHSKTEEWSRQQLSGIIGVLGDCSAAVFDVVDCGFNAVRQVEQLERLIKEKPDAIISIPMGNVAVAEAYKKVEKAGIKLILLDNAPTGLLPGTDYVSLVSADNFGLGRIAAELLSPFVPQDSEIGLLAYDIDFFATNEREIAFRKWIGSERLDLTVKTIKFNEIEDAGDKAIKLIEDHPDIKGLFVVWDTPALHVVTSFNAKEIDIPITTVDLGNEAAINLAKSGLIVGIGAQNPFAQGVAVAQITILALLGRQTPDWVALPGLSVSQNNIVESYQAVWREPAPKEIISELR